MSDPWTIGKVLKASTAYLQQKGSPSARVDAEMLMASALTCERIELYTTLDKPMSESERAACRELLGRRSQGEPVAHILGTKGFWKYDFHVNEHTLVPRPETELLIEVAQEVVETPPARILDIGTGSGCLAISLAKEYSASQVDGWDISDEALQVAELNRNDLHASNVAFSNVDALMPNMWPDDWAYDLIVSNPPYIAEREIEQLDQGIVRFEPHTALFAGEEGLQFYRVFAEYARHLLKPNGWLMVEVGYSQAGKVMDLFEQHHWVDIDSFADLSKIPRVVVARYPGDA